MPLEPVQERSILAPKFDRFVIAGSGNHLTVRAEPDTRDGSFMFFKNEAECSVFVPELNTIVCPRSGNRLTIRTPNNTPKFSLKSLEGWEGLL
jgi:hypothetical protein